MYCSRVANVFLPPDGRVLRKGGHSLLLSFVKVCLFANSANSLQVVEIVDVHRKLWMIASALDGYSLQGGAVGGGAVDGGSIIQ